jgi:predicted nucleotidyltransferase
MGYTKNKRIAGLVERLKQYQPEKIYLFGSWARGEGDSLSDVDLVIIKKTDAPFFDRLKDAGRFLPKNVSVDILVYTPDEFGKMQSSGNAFAQMIAEEGQLVYER